MRVRLVAAALAVVASMTLSGCASPALDEALDDTTQSDLRQRVRTVAEASAAGDWPAALASLDAMATELAAARDEGLVGAERFEAIVLAMELVREDLDTTIAAAADDAERVRLIEEQARLLEQIDQLQDAPAAESGQDDSSSGGAAGGSDGRGASDGGANGNGGRGDGGGEGDEPGGNGKNGGNGKGDRNGG